MFGIGPLELVMILVVALLVFGPKRVPELARTLGRGLAEFRRATNDLRQSLALDELQQDLRRDRLGNKTIHRPGSRPDDRPAQAGDDVDSGAKPAPSDAAADSEGPAAPKHAGELPFDNDHEHHDEAVDADTNPDTNADADSITEEHSNSPADSELGNVPISGSNPADPRRG
jgi:TatA/E family protein of Tat protein translocase